MLALILSAIVVFVCRSKDREADLSRSTDSVVADVPNDGTPAGNVIVTATSGPEAKIVRSVTT